MTGFTDPFGGSTIQAAQVSYANVYMTANIATVWPPYATGTTQYLARLMDIEAATAGLSINLPDASLASDGQDVFISNRGTESFTVNDYGGGAIAVVAAGEQRYIYLSSNATPEGNWRTILMGVGASSPDASQLAGLGLKVIGATLNTASPTATFSANTTFGASDRARTYVNVGGAVTATLDTTTNVTNDFFIEFRNQGTGALTLAPSGGELIDGSATVVLQVNESCIVHAGTGNWYTVGRGRNQQFNFTQLSKSVTGGTTILSLTEASNVVQTYSGTLLSNEILVLPAVVQVYYIINETVSGGYNFTIQSPTPGTTLDLPSGQNAVVFCDGTNVLNVSTSVSGLSSLLLSAGTAAGPSLAIDAANNGLYAPTSTSVAVSANGSNVITWAAGQSLAQVGSVGAPSYSFTGYTGTGIYSPAADEVAIATAGAQRLKISAAGVITLSTPLTVPAGGSGVATLTGLVKGNGAAAFSAASAGTDYVAPGAVTSDGITMSTSSILGRTTAGTGAVEEITIGAGLVLSAGSLAASGGGGGALSDITAAAAANTIANADYAQVWNWQLTTAAKSAFTFGETAAATGGSGSQFLVDIGTSAASTADALRVSSRGAAVLNVNRLGDVLVTALSGTLGSGGSGSSFSATGGTGATNSAGGQANLVGGTGNGSGNGGSVNLTSGTSGTTGISGDVNVTVANPASTTRAGILTLQGGSSRAAQSGNSGGIVVTAGSAGATASIAGGPVVITAGAGSTTTTGGTGGAITITSGSSGLAATGGALTMAAGAGGTTGTGGAVTLTSGAGGATTSNSGNVTISSGAVTNGTSGSITLQTGTGTTAITGNINITVGNAGGGNLAGILTLQGGQSRSAQTGNSGGVVINGGAAGAVASVAGGPVVITGGAGSSTTTGGTGGAVTISGGTAYLAATGGAVSLVGGFAGTGTGVGGQAEVIGGYGNSTGGAGAAKLTGGAGWTGGNGGAAIITGGAASTSGNGGAVTITAGARAGTGAGASVTITATNGITTGAGGGVSITAGNGASAAGGDITLTCGTGSSNGAINFVNTNVANGAVATTVTSLGPTGSSATIVGWLKIKVGGTTQYIPYW